MRRVAICFGLLMLALLTGCGPKRPDTVNVYGVVTLNGRPVEGAAVTFAPSAGGRPATGLTDSQGEFRLTTFETGDGALVDIHTVTVVKKEVSGVQADPDGLSGEIAPGGMQTKWIVPEHYASPDTSGLSIGVDDQMTLPVRLELTNQTQP